MTVKGRIVIEVMEDGEIRFVRDPGLSRQEVNGAVLEAWRLVLGVLDLAWYRTISRAEDPAGGEAALEPDEER